MIFTSYTYLAFLALAVAVYWSSPEAVRKPVLVGASFAFYSAWNWRFSFLLAGVAVANWGIGRLLARRRSTTAILSAGIALNLSLLLYFKYTSFLWGNIAVLAGLFGWHLAAHDFAIVLPLGISFFTFQGVAYLVDVASGEAPMASLLDFLVFKSFWPQLIAGPIIRLHEIREQIRSERALNFDRTMEGGRRVLLGLAKKCLLADTLSPFVDQVFRPSASPGCVDAAVGTLGFGLQIYFDFSAYSDIAIGSAKLVGYDFPENFDWPYHARTPQEFWNRWHITLSHWIRDYVFSPVLFSLRRKPRLALAWLLGAMGLCGLWHGARWTFVLWGVWHGVLLLAGQTVMGKVWGRGAGAPAWIGWLLTFAASQLGWVLFRAESVGQALDLLQALFTLRGGLRPAVVRESGTLIIGLILAGTVFVTLGRHKAEAIAGIWRSSGTLRGVAYAALLAVVIVYDGDARAFVYFQF